MLKGVEAKTKQLNEHILPPDVKVRPYYDRSDLVRLTIDTVEHNLVLGMALVLIVLMFFLVSVRAAVIVALTIPLALLFSFIFLHARGVAANLLSIGAIDFGIIIDGTLVMVENIFRELGVREGQEYDLRGSDAGRGERCGPADFLFRRGDHRRIHPDLRAERAVGKAVSSDGGHDVHRADRRADPDADVRAGDVRLLVQKRRARAQEQAIRVGAREICGASSTGASTIRKPRFSGRP